MPFLQQMNGILKHSDSETYKLVFTVNNKSAFCLPTALLRASDSAPMLIDDVSVVCFLFAHLLGRSYYLGDVYLNEARLG